MGRNSLPSMIPLTDTPHAWKGRGFLVRPGDLLVSMADPPVAVPCPQAFDGYPSVPVCPTVPESAWCKILSAAL